MKAIRDTGNRLVAAADPYDSVGILDEHAPEARFFPCHDVRVHAADSCRMAGVLELERARVRWLPSVSTRDIPAYRIRETTVSHPDESAHPLAAR